jgi:hypothetical protein
MTVATMIMTNDELIKRIVKAVASSTSSLKDAANDIATLEQKGMTQKQIGDAVKKSVGWVNAMLAWKRGGFKGESPFGPTRVQARIQHAERKKAAKPRTVSPPVTPPATESEPTQAAEQKAADNVAATPVTTSAGDHVVVMPPAPAPMQVQATTESKPKSKAFREFKYAAEKYLNEMPDDENAEAMQLVYDIVTARREGSQAA